MQNVQGNVCMGTTEQQRIAAQHVASQIDHQYGMVDHMLTQLQLLLQAIFQSIAIAAAGRHDVFERLCNGILLTGPGASLRGLGPMLERRLMQRFSAAGRQQV